MPRQRADEGHEANALRVRLERGWRLLDEAEATGDNAAWVRLICHWERLLKRYQCAVDAEHDRVRTLADSPSGDRNAAHSR